MSSSRFRSHYVFLDEKDKGIERKATTTKGKRRTPQGRGAGVKERRVQGGTLGLGLQGGGLAWVGSEDHGVGVLSEGQGASARVRVRPLEVRLWVKELGQRARVRFLGVHLRVVELGRGSGPCGCGLRVRELGQWV